MQAVGHLAVRAGIVAVAYYAGANLGFLLRLPPTTPSLLWPPNTILTAALIIAAPRHWWIYLLAALPAHLAAELELGWPVALVVALFLTNCSQALLAAVGIRWLSDNPIRYDTLRRMTVFVVAAGLVAPFLSSFLDAGVVALMRAEPYWLVWSTRFFSNVLTELVLGPAIVMAVTAGPAWFRSETSARKLEAAALVAGLVLAGAWAFGALGAGPYVIDGESVVIVLLPLILLAPVRFGPGGACLALLTTTVIAVTAGAHGHGPFATTSLAPAAVVQELQILLTVLGIPILCLGALIAERREAEGALAEQLRLEMLLSRLSAAFVRLPSHEIDPALATSLRQIGEAAGADRVVLCRAVEGDARVTRHEWSVPGADRGLDLCPVEEFPWTVERMRREEAVVFSRLEDLPAAAAQDVESFRRHGVRSGIIVPLLTGSPIRESLSFVTVSRERTWRDGFVSWLGLVAEVFARALARKEAEDAIRASESSKSAILASLSSAVAVLDRDGRIIDVNASWTRAVAESGGPAPAGLGRGENLVDTLRHAGNDARHARDAAAGILAVLRGARAEFAIEYATRGAVGDAWFAMSVVPLHRPEGGAVVACTDITQRKRAELDAQRSRQELAHFTRLSTMGQATAALAQEMNQPLTGIIINARAGLRLLDTVPPLVAELREILNDIVEDERRAADVIRKVRDHLRQSEPQRVPLDLNAQVREVVRLLSTDAIIRNVTVTLDLAAHPVFVSGDRVELQQVILNLLLNAMDAVADVSDGDRRILVTTEQTPSGTAHVAVRDRGTGFRSDSRDLIFEPFFTTKPSGIGMGLAVARTIVEGYGGAIWADDLTGGGAVVHVDLPAGPATSS
jgi:signal transduction histidine kinase/integral membrane sensor domain MASE1